MGKRNTKQASMKNAPNIPITNEEEGAVHKCISDGYPNEKNDEESNRKNERIGKEHSKGNYTLSKIEKQKVNEKIKSKRHHTDKSTVAHYKSILNASRASGVPLSSFKKLKYAYPSLRESISNGSSWASSSLEKPISSENIGFFNGRLIDISGRFENSTFMCYNTHSCIGCFDCNGRHIVVGLKESCDPFNIFESKEGPSAILILDMDLNVLDRMIFSFGDIAALKICESSLFVLFRNGSLARTEGFDLNKLTILRSTGKITRFDVNSTVYVYAIGNRVYNSLGQSKLYDSVIIDLVINKTFVFTLDINGKIIQAAIDFTTSKELSCKYTFNKIMFVGGLLIALEDDVKSHTVFFPDDPDCMYDSFVSYFLGLFDGTISNFKRYRGKRRHRKVFQVVRNKDSIVFCTNESDFSSEERLYIPAVRDFGDSFIFTTENGLVLRVFYE